jgi:putative membrane protein
MRIRLLMSLIHWLVSTVAILIAAYLIQGVQVDSLLAAIVLAVVLGVINVFFKPVINLLTLPLNIVTLGLFSLVVNALIIMLAGMLVPGVHVDTFWSAFFFSIIVSLVTALFGLMTKKPA